MAADDQEKDLKELFHEYIDAYESAEERPLSDVLRESGIALPPPEEMDDSQLGEKLWEVIRGLSLLGAFLDNTNHLSDRELYTELWKEILPEPTVLMPRIPPSPSTSTWWGAAARNTRTST